MWFLTHTWILPAIMASSFLLILALGKRLPRKGSEIGITAVGIVFVLSLITAGSWWNHINDDGGEHAASAGAVAAGAARSEGGGEPDPAAFDDVEHGCSRAVDEGEVAASDGAHTEGSSEHAEDTTEGGESEGGGVRRR
ncbi:MAG: YidC/Oxa1 family membrane protein insertase [Microthrixaceae bacterium]|nr:YidC/Oxa1 family membrane protein insertase [Microthrixaceae bacterium]